MPVVLALPGPGVAPMLPIELIPRLGLDRLEGISLTLRYFGGGPLAYKDMLAGNSDFAVAGFPAFASMQGVEGMAYSVAAVSQVPAYALMVSERLASQIKLPRDLAGHSIGVHTASKGGRSTAQQMAEYILLKSGVGLNQVNFVASGQNFEAYKAALVSGAIDALIANEPSASRLEDEHLAFRLVDLHDPATSHKYMGDLFLYTHLSCRETTLHQQPEKVQRMVAALRRSLQWISLNAAQDISAALLAKDSPEQVELTRVLSKQKRMFSSDAQFSDRQLHAVEAFLAAIEPGPRRAPGWLEGFIDDRWAGRKP